MEEVATWRAIAMTAGLFWFTVSMNSLIYHAQNISASHGNAIHCCEDAICIAGSCCGFAGALKAWRPSLIIFASSLLPYITRGFNHLAKLLATHFKYVSTNDLFPLGCFFIGVMSVLVFLRCYVLQDDVRVPRVRWLNEATEASSRRSSRTQFFTANSRSWDSLTSPLLNGIELPSIAEPPKPVQPKELTLSEQECVNALKERLPRVEMSLARWLALAHACRLDVDKAVLLWSKYTHKITQHQLCKVSREAVITNYGTGFCAMAGRDRDGRAIAWIRFKYIFPADIPLTVGIVSTWAALDACMMDAHSIRVGTRFVYDFTDIGYKNVATLKVFDFKEAVQCVMLSHPTRATQAVLFLNAPSFFRHCWNVVSPFVPKSHLDYVKFVSTKPLPDGRPWFSDFLDADQLPKYMGGPYCGNYFDWLEMRLADDKPLYMGF